MEDLAYREYIVHGLIAVGNTEDGFDIKQILTPIMALRLNRGFNHNDLMNALIDKDLLKPTDWYRTAGSDLDLLVHDFETLEPLLFLIRIR